jgi:hypothetical protein
MRRESSTVVALVGQVSGGLLAALAEPGNVSVIRAAGPQPPEARGPGQTAGSAGTATTTPAARSARSTRSSAKRLSGADRSTASEGHPSGPSTTGATAPGRTPGMGAGWASPGWEPGARALREAARRRATYVVVANDPLAGVAAAWRKMWDVAAGPGAAAAFEEQATNALAAWRTKQFELPDYYLVVTPAQHLATGPDLYLGPLRAARPRRVAVATVLDAAAEPDGPAVTASLLDTLRSLEHGPWWPPLDELLEAASRFYAGGLAETQPARYS